MAKLKPLSVGLSLGLMLAVIYTIRTIALLLFPDFLVNVASKIMYKMIAINLPVVTLGSYAIGVIALFIGGFVFGALFGAVYNKVGK